MGSMSNPYQTPSFDSKHFQDAAYQPPPNNYGWVSQVRIVSVLNAVQGGLEIPVGLMYLAAAGFIPTVIRMEQANNPNQPNAPPEEMIWFLTGLYLFMGVPALLGGILRIVAGIRNFQFKSRTLGILSFVLGLGSLFSCYCTPTSIAIAVYGLIVMLNPAVKYAFDMGAQGMTSAQILNAFLPYPPQQGYAPQPGQWPPSQPPSNPPPY